MSSKNLNEILADCGDVVDFLRNQQVGPNVYPGVPAEYSNWRVEQRAWQQTCVLFNQSYHMVDLEVTGPDAFAMLNHLGVNSFAGFIPDRAKQFVPCTPDGYVIGDVILFYLEENRFNLVGRAPTIEWVEYHAASGKWNVKVERDERTAVRKDPENRKNYRYQIQGPNSMKVMEQALGHAPPDLKFFHMTRFTIGGCEVRALRHSGYHPMRHYEADPALRSAIDAIAGDAFTPEEPGRYAALVDSLLWGGDHYLLLADYASYVAAHQRVDALYRNPAQWCAKAVANVAGMGPFSSDRTIRDYAQTVWQMAPQSR